MARRKRAERTVGSPDMAGAFEGKRGLILGVASVSVLGYFALAFFADRERVSFHWPVAGWVVYVRK